MQCCSQSPMSLSDFDAALGHYGYRGYTRPRPTITHPKGAPGLWLWGAVHIDGRRLELPCNHCVLAMISENFFYSARTLDDIDAAEEDSWTRR